MDLEVLPGPSLAELARTAVARATTATVSHGSTSAVATVTMRAGPAGQPVLLPTMGSALTRQLAVGPEVTVRVPAVPPFSALQMTGRARGEPCRSDLPASYDVILTAVAFTGAVAAAVPLAQYRAAEPDPLWRQAPGILRHLERGHSAELLACTRAHGVRQAEWVTPVGLDRFGLRLLILTADGITEARLSFPDGPVASFAQLPLSLRTVLSCRCRASRLGPAGPPIGS